MTPPPAEATLITEVRNRSHLTRREAARRGGISEGTLRRFESGRTDIERPPDTLARVAAALGITPAELAVAGREDAAGALHQLMRDTASEPDVSAALGPAVTSGDAGIAALMGEVLQGLAMIDGAGLPRSVKRDLRAEFLGVLTRDAAAWQRQLAALRRAAQS